jgi:predicted nucleic acid-binding protein
MGLAQLNTWRNCGREILSDPIPRYYWDACAWIGLINKEPEKHQNLKVIWENAGRGLIELWTSAYSYVEVLKAQAENGDPLPVEESDKRIDAILGQAYVKRVQLDSEIGRLVRVLRRKVPVELIKRADAIHLASAVWWNLDELHTYDHSHLLALNGKVSRRDGKPLIIRLPDPLADTMFESKKEPSESKK